jgi:uncharacterized protein (DUF1800 family)
LLQPILAPFAFAQQRASREAKKRSVLTDDRHVTQVLSRLTFGARPGDFERVKALGVDAFINQQLDPDSIDDTALAARLSKLPTLGMATPVIFEQYTPPKPTPSPSPAVAPSPQMAPTPALPIAEQRPAVVPPLLPAPAGTQAPSAMMNEQTSGAGDMKQQDANKQQTPVKLPPPKPVKNPQMVVTELQRAALLRAIYSERQLDELMVEFWENHFSINAYRDSDRYLMTGFDRETIRPFAMGRFRDLLGATAHSPAMLFYLDNWRSSVPRPYPATKDKPAGIDGGLNENYARELMELHTLGVDGGYTQTDVQEVARCFSGWTIQKPNEEGLFLYRPGLHDKGEKMVLGHKILAGGGIADGERVLDILASHPATAHFIALKLARRFISDDPPPAVVDRAAAVFLKTDGSIRETLRAIITAPEFFAATAYRAKIRSPFEYVVAALRALNVESDADSSLTDWTRRMGQQIFGRITPDGYPDRAEQWLSAGAMLERFNFAVALANNKIKGTRADLTWLSKQSEGAADSQAVAMHLTNALLTTDISPPTRQALAILPATACASTANVRGVNYTPAANAGTATAAIPPCFAELITMLVGSPEFQRR